MNIIKTTSELSEFCDYANNFNYITVDTEFLRERTYYPKLCLIQLAIPSDQENSAVVIDPLVVAIDLNYLLMDLQEQHCFSDHSVLLVGLNTVLDSMFFPLKILYQW